MQAMPPKQSWLKINGVLKYKETNTGHDFAIFMESLDDNHAVIILGGYFGNHAIEGQSIKIKFFRTN